MVLKVLLEMKIFSVLTPRSLTWTTSLDDVPVFEQATQSQEMALDTSLNDSAIIEQAPQTVEVASSSVQTPKNHVEKLPDPFEGMTFERKNAVEEYWAQYGRERGFPTSVKSEQKRKLHDGDANYLQLVWACEGTHKKKVVPQTEGKPMVRRNTSTIKCGCMAQIRAIWYNGNQWKLSKVEKVHNHGLVTPIKFVHTRGHRHMPHIA